MNKHKQQDRNWRYYFFEVEGEKFCFDCFTYKIFSLTQKLFELLKDGNYKVIKKQYSVFFKKIIAQKELADQGKKIKEENKCKVTINISNRCNLDCVYCYRNKKEKSFLTEDQIDEIFRYIKFDYMPDADCYSLSFCNTSESSLELKKLIYVDSLIAKYEGYYFSKKTIKQKKLIKLYERFPVVIKEKYPLENVYNTLNKILENEKLWKIYDFKKNEYLASVMNGDEILSVSKTVSTNRIILNTVFPDLKLQRPVKYISFWFMTNGTNITDEYIHFLKSIFMKEVTVSIDGNEEVHNNSRKYVSGKGSFSDILMGIKKLQANGIDVIASLTITPTYPNFKENIDYLSSIGIKKITFNLVRGVKAENYFSEETVKQLIENWKKIYEIVYEEIKSEQYHYVNLLKDCYAFSIIHCLYYRIYRKTRCDWKNELVIDSKGNMYHCNSTIDCVDDLLGNYKDKKSYTDLDFIERNVNFDTRCVNCCVKYICGGTCYANDILKNENGRKMECKYKFELIKLGLELYARLYKNGLLKKFIEVIT